MEEIKPPERKMGRWTSLKIVLIFLAIGALFLYVVYTVRGSLRPVFIGCALAMLMKSMCNILYGKGEVFFGKRCELNDKKRGWLHIGSIALTYVIWLSILYAFAALVVPKFTEALMTIVKSIPSAVTSAVAFIEKFITEHPTLSEYSETIIETTVNKLADWAKNDLTKALGTIANSLIGGISGTVSLLFDTVVGVIISFYLLLGRRKLAAQLKVVLHAMLGERFATPVIDELKFANKMFSGYFMGSLIDSTLVGIICYIGTLIFNIPYGVLVAVIVGVTNIIPFFGPYIGMIPSAVIIMTVSPLKALIFVIMMVIVQQIDGNIICPKIVGSTTGLSSFWVLFAILLFGGLFGFVGMIIGVPVFAVFYDIIEKTVRYCLYIRNEDGVMEAYDSRFPKEVDKPKKNKNPSVIAAFIGNATKRLKNKSSVAQSSDKTDSENQS